MKTVAGKRGRGRPRIGERRVISITLPEEEWEKVESLIHSGYAGSAGDYFRQVHDSYQSRLKAK
ncbi:hypothetical protein [Paenibacillus sp. NAIST15-1]|uniref:hypothetical protein n=1 Tax=Paenibacillus sp. NAIST15-1 TaxID=1605994 RepID=UPI000869618E|nr:hypothetical protein [Paenibacillus sp. NAIST15-1]GAV16098.1 hypothetical protein PBN151_6083 [Paenibacillus sp. NAIST15-1]